MKTYSLMHPLAERDLNIFRGLYAPVAMSWFIEAGVVGAMLAYGDRKGVVYVDTHKFTFKKKVLDTDIISFRATPVRFGRCTITMHVDLYEETIGEVKGEGYVTFVTVKTDTTEACAHGMVLDETSDPEEIRWRNEAAVYFERNK